MEPLAGSANFATWKRLLTSYLKAKQVWDEVSRDFEQPDCRFKYVRPIASDICALIDRSVNGAARQSAITSRLVVEVQLFEYCEKWSKCEAEAYHIILRHLSPEVSVHAAGTETSRQLWQDLDERYRQMELATYCELFTQLKETTTDSCTRRASLWTVCDCLSTVLMQSRPTRSATKPTWLFFADTSWIRVCLYRGCNPER